uniref:Uncharacterized protein n=1 Tax=Hyaloperonospora arabidopsidis (strain Emoy2) TaxID=559515 RepID=M4BJS0_HYAAE
MIVNWFGMYLQPSVLLIQKTRTSLLRKATVSIFMSDYLVLSRPLGHHKQATRILLTSRV